MDDKTRQALGLLVVAAIAGLAWLVIQGEPGTTAGAFKAVALVLALLTALVGLGLLAKTLLTPARD